MEFSARSHRLIRLHWLLLIVLGMWCSTAEPFVHPGQLNSNAELNFMRDQVNSSQQPWLTYFNQIPNYASYTPQITTAILDFGGASGAGGIHQEPLQEDCRAAYHSSLQWVVTGTTARATKAIELLNNLATRVTGSTGTNGRVEWPLRLAPCVLAAEIMRYRYTGWPASEATAFANWLINVVEPRLSDWGGPGSSIASVGRGNLMRMQMGVFANHQVIFDRGVNDTKAFINYYIGSHHSGLPTGNGFTIETCREGSCATCGTLEGADLPHAQAALKNFVWGAEIAKHQGLNLYDHIDPADGAGLYKALTYHDQWIGFLEGRSGATSAGWPCQTPITQQNVAGGTDADDLWHLAANHYGDASFRAIRDWMGNRCSLSAHFNHGANCFGLTHRYGASAPADTEDPSVPGSPAAVANSSTQITVSWTASTDNVGVTGYEIAHCTAPGCTPTTQLAIDPASPFAHTGLAPASLHRYRIRAQDAAGNESAQTATVEATTDASNPADATPPSTPGSPVAVADSSSQITLTWTASTDNVAVTGYRIDHCTAPGCTPTAQLVIDAGSPFVHQQLAASSLHRYRIRAQDAAGNLSTATATVEVTTPAPPLVDTTPPTVPGSPAAVANSSTQITLSWAAATDNVGVTGYRIDHCTTAGCAPSAQLVVDASSPFVHQNLAAESLHRYRIRAQDAAGNLSAATQTVEAITDAAPPSPGAGNTYYVATTGSNTNPGTLSQPFLTIGKAFSTMVPGDTTFVRGGLYMMNNASPPAGTSTVLSKDHTQWTKPITVRNYPGEIAEFQQIITVPKTGCAWRIDETKPYTKYFLRIIGEARPDTFDPTDSSGGTGIIFNNCQLKGLGQYIWVEHVEFKNFQGTQSIEIGAYSTLKNLNCHHSGLGSDSNLNHCVYTKPNHLTIDGGLYHHNSAYGLHIFHAQSPTNFCVENWVDLDADECGLKFIVIKNTKTFANGTGGITISWGAGTTMGGQNEISNNSAYDNGDAGITMRTPNSRVINNTVYHNKLRQTGGLAQLRITGANIEVINNVVWGAFWPAVSYGGSPDPSTIFHNNVFMKQADPCHIGPDDPTPCVHYDPQVVNLTGRDFRLKSTSPLINAGVNLAGVPKSDQSGALRVGVPDIGAWEFGAAAPCTKPGGDCTAPSVPLNLTATLVSPTHVALDWADSTGSPTQYQVARCGGLAGCTPTTIIGTPTASTFADTTVAANNPYTWAVTASDANNNVSEQSAPVSLTTTAPPTDGLAPSVPTGLSFSPVAFDQINGTWTASTDAVGVTGYRVRRCDATAVPGCTPATQVGTTNTPSFSSPNLSAATAYRFTVAAEDAAGNVSAYSSVASATTPVAPATPETVLLLNNDVQDSSGQGHHGTTTGVTFDAANKVEGTHAALFDATTDRLTVPMPDFLTPNQLTIAVNVRPTAFGSRKFIIGHSTIPFHANVIQLCTGTAGELQLGLGSTGGCGLNPAIMPLVLNTWYHLVLRLNNGTYTVDVDGIRRATGTYTGLTTWAPTLGLGHYPASTQAFTGQIDAVTVVGRVWSDLEVDANCDLYVPGGCNPPAPPTFDPFVMAAGVQGDGVAAPANTRIVVTMTGVPHPTACQNLADFLVAYAQAREPVTTCTLSGSTLTLGVANPPATPLITLALTYLPTAQQIPLTNQTVADPTVSTDLQQVSYWCRPDGQTDDEPWLGLPNTPCRVPSPGVLNLRVDVVNVGAVPSPEQTYKLYCDRDVGDQVLAQRITEVFPSPIGIFLNMRTEGVVPDGTPRTPVLPAIVGITPVTAGTMERDDQSSISPVLAPQTRTEYEFSLAFMADIPRGTVFSCGLRAGDAGIPLSQTNLATIRIDHARWVVR